MNEFDLATLTAAIKKVLLIFAVVVNSVLGGIAGGIIPFLIILPIGALLFGNDPAVGMGLTVVAIPLFYVGAPIGLALAAKWSWEHLVKKSAKQERRGFPVIQSTARGS